MNTSTRFVLACVALAIVLSACGRREPPAWTGDPTVPDAATAFAKDDAEKAKAEQEAAAAEATAKAHEEMTKGEESKAMPLPGQANDHSTTALDKNKND